MGLGRRAAWSRAALGAGWGLTASLSNAWWLWLKGNGSVAQMGKALKGKSSFKNTLALSQSFCAKGSRCDPNLIQVNDRIWVKVPFSGVETFFSTPSSWHYQFYSPAPKRRKYWNNFEKLCKKDWYWNVISTQGHQFYSSYEAHVGLEIIPVTQDHGFTSCPQLFQEVLLAPITQVIDPVMTQEQSMPPTMLLPPLPSATLEVSSEVLTKALTKSAQPGISVWMS